MTQVLNVLFLLSSIAHIAMNTLIGYSPIKNLA